MKHVTNKIQAYVAGELSGAEQQAVTLHLAECPACARDAEQARDLWQMLGEVAATTNVPAPSAWPEIQAKTFGRGREGLIFGAGLWTKTGVASLALAAGLALAILLPSQDTNKMIVATENGAELGSAFWLDDQSGTTSFSDLWLAAADEGNES